jgi:hypothetical protein
LPFLHVEHRSDTADDSDVPLDLEQLVVNASAQLILLHTQERKGRERRGKGERGEEREREERKREEGEREERKRERERG